MSETTTSLRRKIDGAQELQAVVRTMKAVAASSIGQYEKAVRALAQYDRTVELGLAVCLRDADPATSLTTPTLSTSAASDVAVVVFGSDQGLVGQFNESIADYAIAAIADFSKTPHIWAVGERVQTHLQDTGTRLEGRLTLPNSVDAITQLVGQILLKIEGRHDGDVTELHLVFNRRTVGSQCSPVVQRLLPLDADWSRRLGELPWPTHRIPQVIGSRAANIAALIREYVFVSLFRACAESLASENASRLAAMERAEKNIEELLENLHTAFARLRQEGIDEELFDVISGYEALRVPRV